MVKTHRLVPGRLGHSGSKPDVPVFARSNARHVGFRILIVWTGGVLQGETSQRGTLGLAPLYQAYLWSVLHAPGHHGYERAFDLICGQASKGYWDPQYSIAPVRPVLHCVGYTLADLGGKGSIRRTWDALHDISLFG